MLGNISGVPCMFVGFKEHEEEIDRIVDILSPLIFPGMDGYVAWNTIAKAFTETEVDSIIFVISKGICFSRIG